MLVEQILPEAKKLINDKVLEIVKEKGPKVALAKVYNMFPFYIRAVVKEDAFVNFCLTHQDKIFGATATAKVAPKKAVKKVAVKKVAVKAVKKVAPKKIAKKK